MDDNAQDKDNVKIILRGFGAQYVFEAKDPVEALSRLRHDAIDIVVLEL